MRIRSNFIFRKRVIMSLSNSIKLNSNKRVHTKVIGLVILLVLLNFQGYKEGEGHWQAITVRGKLDLQKKKLVGC